MTNSLEKFEEIVKILDKDTASVSEVAEIIATIIQVVKEAKDFLEKQAVENKSELNDSFNHAISNLESIEGKMKKEMMDMHSRMDKKMSDEMNNLTKSLYIELKKLEDSIPAKADFTEIYGKIKEVEGKIPKVPDEITGEQIIDKINDDESEKKIKREKVEGLNEELTAIRNLPRGGGGASRRVFIPYRDDFSSLTDGTTKIFYLSRAPLDDAMTMVFGTDFPVILRPTIDYTIANKVLTLTSAVPAPSSGSTLICTFFA